MTASMGSLTEQLKSKNIRPSYQRVKVLEYLQQKQGHPTADEIFLALTTDIPSLSRGTVYNTLHTLVEAGLIHEVDIDETGKRYDITLANHGHFHCASCGTIFNFTINLDQVPTVGLDQFEITHRNITFKGLCPNCKTPTHIHSKETIK